MAKKWFKEHKKESSLVNQLTERGQEYLTIIVKCSSYIQLLNIVISCGNIEER